MGRVTTRIVETMMARGVGSSIEDIRSRISEATVILAGGVVRLVCVCGSIGGSIRRANL